MPRHRSFIIAPALLIAAAATHSPAASTSPEPVRAAATAAEEPAYGALYDAILSGVDKEKSLDQICAAMAQQIVTASPAMIEVESAFPGFGLALAQAVRPVLASQSDRVRLEYRPRVIAVLKQELTPSEALDIAVFYRSRLGRKMLNGVSQTYNGKAAIASGLDGREVSDADVRADLSVAARQTVSTMNAQDLAEMGRLTRQKPALLKMRAISQAMPPVLVAIQNAPLTPAEEAEIDRLVGIAATVHFAKFQKAGPAT